VPFAAPQMSLIDEARVYWNSQVADHLAGISFSCSMNVLDDIELSERNIISNSAGNAEGFRGNIDMKVYKIAGITEIPRNFLIQKQSYPGENSS
jgi:hypothetical protein